MDVKRKVLLELFNKNKLKNGTKTFLEPNFFFIYSQIKKIRVSCPFKLSTKLSAQWDRSLRFKTKDFKILFSEAHSFLNT